ncbi:hypothetical protein L1787_14200 [Acuticoccus sp. M5D2P5]|uniref:hypothetical protein n=1 Tax=Acuticoccus kalidii TaxID=2910977 RepID=UPI001F46042F|nr:hypothetical protein [Acuticoccus kalidii]MCF3934556.1 hypothetical protein [Acuticoccus kalidii]
MRRTIQKAERMTAAQRLRALRQPLVALSAILLVSNLLLPVAAFSGGSVAGVFCYGAGPYAVDGDDTSSDRHFQTCCFSAAVALLPPGGMASEACPQAPQGTIAPLTERIRAERLAGSARIRAPPVS